MCESSIVITIITISGVEPSAHFYLTFHTESGTIRASFRIFGGKKVKMRTIDRAGTGTGGEKQ